jgi:hypothetical protein
MNTFRLLAPVVLVLGGGFTISASGGNVNIIGIGAIGMIIGAVWLGVEAFINE